MSGIATMEVLCAVALVFAGIWYYLKASYNFWKKRGVPGPKPTIFFGNFKDVMLARVSIGEALQQMCAQFSGEPMVGVYLRRAPVLLLRDPELLKDVFIRDFSYFTERGLPMFEQMEPLSAHLVNLETKRWKSLRPKLSPAFTSGKMKHMYTLILECTEYFVKYIDTLVDKGDPIDCQEMSAKLTTDIIGSCAFGLEMNSLGNEDGEFRKMGRKALRIDLETTILITLQEAAPWLYKLIGRPVFSDDITQFFTSSIRQTMDHRRKNNFRREDLVDILLEIKDSSDKLDFELTDSLITAQAFVFFLAGFETSSTAISVALLELAQRQDIQEKLRQEIVGMLDKNNGEISYNDVKEMKYLHMVFQETLRLRPPVLFIMRKAVKDYKFRKLNLEITKGQGVWVPIWEIHHNPENYPNPELFDPDRFSEENSKTRHPMTYLPFGDGPRNCIGARFAVYQTKLALIKILANYKVEVCEKTKLPFKLQPVGFLLKPVGGVHLKFSKLTETQ